MAEKRRKGDSCDNAGDSSDSISEEEEEEEEEECGQSRPESPHPTPRHVVSPLTADLAENNIKRHQNTSSSLFNRG